MVKWRIERGVVQQTESLVRGFYEVKTISRSGALSLMSAIPWSTSLYFICVQFLFGIFTAISVQTLQQFFLYVLRTQKKLIALLQEITEIK